MYFVGRADPGFRDMGGLSLFPLKRTINGSTFFSQTPSTHSNTPFLPFPYPLPFPRIPYPFSTPPLTRESEDITPVKIFETLKGHGWVLEQFRDTSKNILMFLEENNIERQTK